MQCGVEGLDTVRSQEHVKRPGKHCDTGQWFVASLVILFIFQCSVCVLELSRWVLLCLLDAAIVPLAHM